MDADVLAAIARWPKVPAVFGWLALTARGQWRIGGEAIGNRAIRGFIGRNYDCDAQGRWYFQNGPQRVYVTLELAPWVYRVQPDGRLRTFTELAPRRLLAAALVDGSAFVLLTELGAGKVDDRDLERFLPALTDGSGQALDETGLQAALESAGSAFVAAARCGLGEAVVPLQRLTLAELGPAFGFQREPAPG